MQRALGRLSSAVCSRCSQAGLEPAATLPSQSSRAGSTGQPPHSAFWCRLTFQMTPMHGVNERLGWRWAVGGHSHPPHRTSQEPPGLRAELLRWHGACRMCWQVGASGRRGCERPSFHSLLLRSPSLTGGPSFVYDSLSEHHRGLEDLCQHCVGEDLLQLVAREGGLGRAPPAIAAGPPKPPEKQGR